METIVPATGEWNLCHDNPTSSTDIFRLPILAWAISPHAPPIPITPFGRADTCGEYLLHVVTEAGAHFVVLPNGPILAGNDFYGAKAWLVAKDQVTA
jgi:hypothetical protein